MIKLLAEYGNPQNKSVLLQMPQHILNDLQVGLDDTVNVKSLLTVLQRYYDEFDGEITLEEHVNLMDMIFNTDRAVDEKKFKS